MRDQRRSRFQNMTCGTIILFQPDHFSFWIDVFEFKHIGDLSPAPTIDGLIIITNTADVPAFLGK